MYLHNLLFAPGARRVKRASIASLAVAIGILLCSGRAAAIDAMPPHPTPADSLLANGHYRAAADQFLIQEEVAFDRSRKAYYATRAAMAYTKAEKLKLAQSHLQRVLKVYGNDAPYEAVFIAWRDIAEHYATGKGTFMGWKRRDKAIEVMRELIAVAPHTGATAEHLYQIGQWQAEMGGKSDAVATFERVSSDYPDSDAAAAAQLTIITTKVQQARKSDGDGSYSRDALQQLEALRRRYPQFSQRPEVQQMWSQARQQQASYLYSVGEFYTRQAHFRPAPARRYLNDVIRLFPETAAADKAKTLLLRLGEKFGSEPAAAALAALPAKAVPGSTPATNTGITAAAPAPGAAALPPRQKLADQNEVNKWLLPLEDLALDKN